MTPDRVSVINYLEQLKEYLGAEELLHDCFYLYLSTDELYEIVKWATNDFDLSIGADGQLTPYTSDI
jgi:predicted RecB family endonuclease